MTESQTIPAIDGTIPGVPLRVELRCTLQPNGTVLWSADGFTSYDGPNYVGTGKTPAEACDELSRVMAFHARPITEE